ncbi:VanZ family protein [Natronomonas sp. EA1]|uniref:VanZ family protein n=1 Tax=Natronomonas sp. EA1 TaxID=3421655 RepID=UPI003EB8872A
MSRIPFPAFPRPVRYAGVAAVIAVIAYFSLFGVVSQPGTGPWWDKKLHFAAYAGLGLAMGYATIHHRDRPAYRIGLILLVAGGYGALIEVIQWGLPYRYFGWGDLAANLVGALLAVGLLAAERVIRYVPVPAR